VWLVFLGEASAAGAQPGLKVVEVLDVSGAVEGFCVDGVDFRRRVSRQVLHVLFLGFLASSSSFPPLADGASVRVLVNVSAAALAGLSWPGDTTRVSDQDPVVVAVRAGLTRQVPCKE
jgi:hypothetical protein